MIAQSLLKSIFAVAALGLVVTPSSAAEAYPSRPIRIIVPAAPGGSLDLTTRLVARRIGEKLAQTVIVENRPGGDTLIGTRVVKDLPADGYTVLATSNGFTMLPYTSANPGYDPLTDFTGVGFMTRSPMILEVASEQPDQSVADLITRSKKAKLTYASGGTGHAPHLACAIFSRAAGIEMLHVPYKGVGAALPDVVAGRVTAICDAYLSSAPFLKGGKLRPLAVTSPTRITPLPNVPTLAELGVPVTYQVWLGLVVKSGTPKDVVEKLSDALRYALTSKELVERFRSESSDPAYVTPDAFNAYLAKEYAQTAKLAVDLKLSKE